MSIAPERSPHIPYLDGARGIAAFTVFIYHLAELSRWRDTPAAHRIELVFNGADAVSFFFVLSGFVLSFRYLHRQPATLRLSLKQYLNSRFWRIYPAFWATLIAYLMIGRHSWNLPALLYAHRDFFREATLLHGIYNYNGADWSLATEIGLSVMLPFMMLVILRSRRWFAVMTVLYFLLPRMYSLFVLHFLLGIAIAWYYPFLSSLSTLRPKLYRLRWLLLPVAAVLFDVRLYPKIFPALAPLYDWLRRYFFLDVSVASAIGSAVFIIYLLNSKRAQKLLSLKPVLFLGRISYSIYLVQGLWAWMWSEAIITWMQAHVGSGNSVLFAGCAIIGGSGLILTAALSYYLFEKPGIFLGKKFYDRL